MNCPNTDAEKSDPLFQYQSDIIESRLTSWAAKETRQRLSEIQEKYFSPTSN